jgi:N-alpha-acetyltransferase 38, NatC auxiliary subunit
MSETVVEVSGEIKKFENKEKSSREGLKSFLTKKMRIEISDGRVFIGNLICLDNQKNIVLLNTNEYTLNGDKEYKRMVGQVMIPGNQITKIWAEEKQ